MNPPTMSEAKSEQGSSSSEEPQVSSWKEWKKRYEEERRVREEERQAKAEAIRIANETNPNARYLIERLLTTETSPGKYSTGSELHHVQSQKWRLFWRGVQQKSYHSHWTQWEFRISRIMQKELGPLGWACLIVLSSIWMSGKRE